MLRRRRTPFSSMTRNQALALPRLDGQCHVYHTVRNGLDFRSRADRFIGSQAALGVDEVRSKNGVDQS